MTFRHYSAKPFTFDPARSYLSDTSDFFKPRGLWLSVVGEGDWKNWCESESFNVDGLKYTTDFTLSPDSNVLQLTDDLSIRIFSQRFRRLIGRSSYIDWVHVASLYDGLVIAPYSWKCRLDLETFWYYSWDCASACIWNLRAVQLAGVTA